MNEPLQLTFRYTQTDYVRALRAHYATRLNLPLDLAVVAAGAGIGAYLWQTAGLHWYSALPIVASAVLGLMLLAAFLVIPPLAYRREPKLHEEYSLTFTPDEIHFRTRNIDSHLEWQLYTRALITAHSYVLYHGSRQFSVIPKRVFRSDQQRHAFEELLTAKISQIVRRGN